jgi:hypothetical protein
MKKLSKIKSLNELRHLAASDNRYLQLALIAASNLGSGTVKTLDQAMNWLNTNAMETDERGVVGEVNFCRNLVK